MQLIFPKWENQWSNRFFFTNVTWESCTNSSKNLCTAATLNCKTCQPHKNVLSHKIQQWENGICGILIYLLVHVLPVDMLLEHSPIWKVMPLYFVAFDTCNSENWKGILELKIAKLPQTDDLIWWMYVPICIMIAYFSGPCWSLRIGFSRRTPDSSVRLPTSVFSSPIWGSTTHSPRSLCRSSSPTSCGSRSRHRRSLHKQCFA